MGEVSKTDNAVALAKTHLFSWCCEAGGKLAETTFLRREPRSIAG